MTNTRNNPKAETLREATAAPGALSLSEQAVLSVFRKYLMSPGKMLCFSHSELEAFDESLTQLTDKGLLAEESFQGGYSLTEAGFAAMRDGT